MTDVGLIWKWEWGVAADVGEACKGWDMTGVGLVWEWGDGSSVCSVWKDGIDGWGEWEVWEATLSPRIFLPLPAIYMQ